MLSMTTSTVQGTAILRGAYNFVGTTAAGAITSFLSMSAVLGDDVSRSDAMMVSALTGVLAGLAALGFRGGVEGVFDARRAVKNDVRPSDVPVEAPDVAVIEPAKP